MNTADIDAAKLKQLKDEVIRNLNSGGIPEGHYIQSPPSYIRRKLVTAGFAKGLGDELQEILGWAKKSSYTGRGEDKYKAGGDIIPINFEGESRRLMLSGDRPSALRAIFMMMYADKVGGRSVVGYVGPGGKYYLTLRPLPPTNSNKRKRGGNKVIESKLVTRKHMRKKRNTKKRGPKIKNKNRKSRIKKRAPKNSRRRRRRKSSSRNK